MAEGLIMKVMEILDQENDQMGKKLGNFWWFCRVGRGKKLSIWMGGLYLEKIYFDIYLIKF